jgi:hypothetical protein
MKISPTFVHGSTVAALVVSMACVAAPALAQQQASVNIVGEANLMCILGQPSQGDGVLNNFDTPSGTVFGITNLADAETLTTQAANITLTMDAMCNSIHRVIIASDNNGLWRNGVGATPSGFGSAVPYTANLVWADQQYALTAEAADRQGVEEQMLIGRPNTGAMLIEFSINPGATNAGIGAPLLSGEYSDVLRIKVETQ